MAMIRGYVEGEEATHQREMKSFGRRRAAKSDRSRSSQGCGRAKSPNSRVRSQVKKKFVADNGGIERVEG